MEAGQIVSRDPEIMNGALVFADTRVPVEVLVEFQGNLGASTGRPKS